MALRTKLTKRLLHATIPDNPSPITTFLPSPIPPPTTAALNNIIKANFRRYFVTSADAASTGFFRRFFQRRAINNHSSPMPLPFFLNLPVGEKLRQELKSINNSGHQLPRLDELRKTAPFSMDAADAKRLLRFVQIKQIRERLRNIPASTIQYGELLRLCGDACGDAEMGVEIAKALDESGNVIVLGGVVFLRPDLVARSMERLISEAIAMPNDPRRKELDILEHKKAQIDERAQSMVRGELYCGLGFLVVQTLGFMRLTFWELSWDVMEPICFFVTSLHFALAYAFFLRTSKEPSFEGYFQRRFKVKQNKLMKIHSFDTKRYNQLCEAFYPNYGKQYNNKNSVGSLGDARGALFG